jgi:hypothetical protein
MTLRKKVKQSNSTPMKATSALDGVSGQRHAPSALYPLGKTPGTHWIGGCVCLTTGLDTEASVKNPLASAGHRNPITQSSSP